MLAIKLRIVGKKHARSFRMVVQEKKSKLQGKFIDDLGWYNPHTKNSVINMERVELWLSQGAKPTATAGRVLVKARSKVAGKIPVSVKSESDSAASKSAKQS